MLPALLPVPLAAVLACAEPSPPPASAPTAAAPTAAAPTAAAPTAVPPAPVPPLPSPAAPSSAAPGHLLVRGPDCALRLLPLPPGEARTLVPAVDCDTALVVLDAEGGRALLGEALLDLVIGTATPLPPRPAVPDEADWTTGFDERGAVLAVARWGEDPIGFEEGPVYARTLERAWRLEEGAWSEVGRRETGPDRPADEAATAAWAAATRTRGPVLWADAGEWVPEGALREALAGFGEGDWFTAGAPPRVAWRVEPLGEGSEAMGPAYVLEGAAWRPLDGTADAPLEADEEGDWLLLAQGAAWRVVDLRSGAVATSGPGRAWSWPLAVPLPEACTLGEEALVAGLAPADPRLRGAPRVAREGRQLVERAVLADGTLLERRVGGCHHLLLSYTWRGGPPVSGAAALAALDRDLAALPLQDAGEGVRAQLLEAVHAAGSGEVGPDRVDLACGEASCAFSWSVEGGVGVREASYQFTL